MVATASRASPTQQDDEAKVVKKVFRRLMWFLLILFVCSYLDRINMSFAALSMNKALGLSATMFGLANTVFYIAYVSAEIPSNMALARFGARIWIPRIMITWGIASTACMFAVGPNSLSALRALVGLAEAGFMPGVLLYITFWFPPAYRARAFSLFIMAQPITLMFGSTVSGLILDMNGAVGLAGWQWLFLLEGVPSVILGIVAWFYLSDSPTKAKWLNANEKATLAHALAHSQPQQSKPTADGRSIWRELLSAPVVLLSLTYFGVANTLNANSTWVPQIVRAMVPDGSFTMVGLLIAIPPAITVCLMPLWCAHSDRKRERIWHFVLALALAASGFLCIINFDAALLKFLGLIGVAVGAFSAQSIFWAMPATYMSERARPIGFALVNTVGMLGQSVGPLIIGALKDLTQSFNPGLVYVVLVIGFSIVCILAVSSKRVRNLQLQPDIS